MKKLFNIAILFVLLMGSVSCEKWLDVNTDPDKPNSSSALVNNRLPWIQHFYSYAAGTANMRTACTAGVYYSNNANNNKLSTTWECNAGTTTTVYQGWFIECANNLPSLYDKAEEEGAYYYMGAAEVIHAMGFMMMLDLYGEMPYTEALVANPSPAYDDGKTIYEGCLAKLDHAIELFSMEQGPNATAFSLGDMWCGGDPAKWLKLCYGLKARYLLKLSKKTNQFDGDAILECLSKGPQSNDDNAVMLCYNVASDVVDYWFKDPVMTNPNWDVVAYGNNQRISKFHKDLLVNMRGAGVEDPRMTKIVPAAMADIKVDNNGKVISYKWIRSEGVDIYGEAKRLLQAGAASISLTSFTKDGKDITYTIEDNAIRTEFIAAMGSKVKSVNGNDVKVSYPKGSIFVDSNNYMYAGDTAYVNLRSASQLTLQNSGQPENDMNWYSGPDPYTAGAVLSTGSFQVRPNSDFDILTYYEMCFIKAEVLMRQGKAPEALIAYKAGIKAHMDRMQTQLRNWQAGGYAAKNPDMAPMDEAAITNYLASAAVAQSSGELTMSDIMLQKYIAMGCSIENWNDMRRFNFSAGNIGSYGVVYPGYDRGPMFSGQAQLTGTVKTDPTYWQRRWRLPDKWELTVNKINAQASSKIAYETNVWCYPVWWDCETDDEYYGYIR